MNFSAKTQILFVFLILDFQVWKNFYFWRENSNSPVRSILLRISSFSLIFKFLEFWPCVLGAKIQTVQFLFSNKLFCHFWREKFKLFISSKSCTWIFMLEWPSRFSCKINFAEKFKFFVDWFPLCVPPWRRGVTQCLKITEKSLKLHCERSELRLHFEWTKVH